ILPAGTVTLGRRGKTLAPLGEMAGAGAVAFSDDGDMVADSNLMRQAVAYCTALGVPIMDHPEDPSLVAAGVINDGPVAARLGLAGRPASAEAVAVARDISLAEATGGWIHLQHVSTRGAADLLRQARARGVRVTAEATPHHLTMTDAWAYGEAGEEPAALGLHAYDTNTRVNPPLRSADDVSAVVEALADGTIDVVATDHAPHAPSEKRTTYDDAPAGMNVLETAFAQVNTLARQGKIGLSALIGRLSARPAALLGMELGALRPGWPADIVLLDPEGEWVVDASRFASRSRNTPLQGRRVTGKVKMTIFRGEVVHDLTREGEAVGG
ncbi:MAG: dihydroorotase, partial [Chloroflexota bacterium]